MSTDLSQFQESFFEESAEHLSTIEDGLLQLEQHPEDLDLLNRIFRAAHSIKGNSGMFGFTAVGQFTHKMETLLDQLRNGHLSVTPAIADVLLRSTDCLKVLIDAAHGEAAPEPATIAQLEGELAAAAGESPKASQQASPGATTGPGPSSGPAQQRYRITWTPPGWLFQRGLDPLRIIGELEELGTIESRSLDVSRLPAFSALDPEVCYFSWTCELRTVKQPSVIEAVFDFVREDSVLTIEECEASSVKRISLSDSSASRETNGGQRSENGEPKPLGEILVETGVVSRETLDKALAQQKRVGEILIEQHAATPQQISQALQKQQESAAPKKPADTASIRVDTAKIDKLI
ncbi:MAG: Hpt domain-containing protein, partial [Nitrospiraceae bacterium]|nr:Hpt domain-containing protein [Nitrospiraceae bacterium]